MAFCKSPAAGVPRCARSRRRLRRGVAFAASDPSREVWLIDYGAGNVRSVRNAVTKLGYVVRDVQSAADVAAAPRLLFPGVGAFGSAMEALKQRRLVEPLRAYLQARGRHALALALQPHPCSRRGAPSWASAWACSCCLMEARRAAAWRGWA